MRSYPRHGENPECFGYRAFEARFSLMVQIQSRPKALWLSHFGRG